MESWQSHYVLNNLRDLTEYIRCSPLFVAELTSKNVLSIADNAELNAEPNRLKKSKYLLDVLMTRKNGYNELLKALHETTQTGARDILLIGVLHNLKLQISSNPFLLKEYFTETETKQFYCQLSSSQFEELYFCLILYLENHQPFQIMKQTIPEKISYYIPRILSKRLRLNPGVFMQSCSDIFVVKGSDRNTLKNLAGKNKIAYSSDQLDEITAQVIVLEDTGDWEELQEINTLQLPMHLIEHNIFTGIFILKESKGASIVIRKFLETDKKDHNVTIAEEQFMCEVEKEKCKGVCICDMPGMGKTILIESLARRAEQEVNKIVAFIRLHHFTQIACKYSQVYTSMEIVLQYVSNPCGSLPVHVLKKIMELKEMQINVFFDGYDEIEEKYLEWTENFLKSLTSENKIRVFVTSRPHMRDKLEETLGVIAYDILPFNTINQLDFFAKFWLYKNPKLDPAKLKEFASICLKEFNRNIPQDERDIAGVPLICLLIADIYIKHAVRYVRKNAHLNKNWVSFGKTMFDIYKKFTDNKFKSKNVVKTPKLSEIKKVKDQHYQKAILQIFPEFVKNSMKNLVADTNDDFDNNIFSYGLIHKVKHGNCNTHQFIHRTIAECMVAEYAISQLAGLTDKDKNCHDSINPFIILLFQNMLNSKKIFNGRSMSIIFTQGTVPQTHHSSFNFSTVMYFMEHQLNQNSLPKSIYNSVLRSINSTSTTLNLTQLIECCAYQNLVNVFRFIENIVLISSHVEVISQESLCNTITIICQFSSCEFVKNSIEFVRRYFSFSFDDIFQACIKNRWLTPLQHACHRISYDVVDYFLENSCSTDNQCLIHFCARTFERDVNVRNTNLRVDIIERLLSVNPKLLFERDFNESFPTFPTSGDVKLLSYLIEKGSDIFAINKFGDTLAHSCVYYNYVSLNDEFKTGMMFLITNSKEVDILKIRNKKGKTPIHEAVKYVNDLDSETLKWMLSNTQMNVNEENNSEETLLYGAISQRKSLEILNVLIESGANYTFINSDGESLLHRAAKIGNSTAVKLLLKLGLNPNHKNKRGKTPLELAKKWFCTGELNISRRQETIEL